MMPSFWPRIRFCKVYSVTYEQLVMLFRKWPLLNACFALALLHTACILRVWLPDTVINTVKWDKCRLLGISFYNAYWTPIKYVVCSLASGLWGQETMKDKGQKELAAQATLYALPEPCRQEQTFAFRFHVFSFSRLVLDYSLVVMQHWVCECTGEGGRWKWMEA